MITFATGGVPEVVLFSATAKAQLDGCAANRALWTLRSSHLSTDVNFEFLDMSLSPSPVTWNQAMRLWSTRYRRPCFKRPLRQDNTPVLDVRSPSEAAQSRFRCKPGGGPEGIRSQVLIEEEDFSIFGLWPRRT